jgi:outer membrane protein assembly factor BamB
MAGLPTDRVAIAFEIKRDTLGKLRAYLYQQVANFYGLELPGEVVKQGDKYILKEWALSLTPKNGGLEGTLYPIPVPISLTRTAALPSEVPVPDLPHGPGPKWQTKLGAPIYAPAAVRDGMAYVGTSGGMFYAVSLADGKSVWAFAAGRPVFGGAAVVGSALFFVCDGFLFKLDRASGAVVWRVQLSGSSAESEAFPAGGSLFLFGSSDLRRITLMDSKDGRVIWRTDVFGWAWPRPTLEGNTVFVSTVGGAPYQMRHLGALTALDRPTGKILWRWPMPEWPGSWTNGFHATPIVGENLVVVGGLDGSLYAFPIH